MDEPTTPPQPSAAAPEPIASASTVMPSAGSTPTPGSATPPKPRPSRRIYVILGVLLVILVALIAWRLVELRRQANTAAVLKPATVSHTTTVSPTGTDNQSLSNDLSTVNNGLNTENQAQSAANTAVNDQQQEVNVPTN